MSLDLLDRGAFAPREATAVAHQLDVKSWPRTRVHPTMVSSAKETCWPAVIVTLWDKQNYKGSSVALFCTYPNLGTIGWGDRAQSGKNAYLFQEIEFFKKINYKEEVYDIQAGEEVMKLNIMAENASN